MYDMRPGCNLGLGGCRSPIGRAMGWVGDRCSRLKACVYLIFPLCIMSVNMFSYVLGMSSFIGSLRVLGAFFGKGSWFSLTDGKLVGTSGR